MDSDNADKVTCLMTQHTTSSDHSGARTSDLWVTGPTHMTTEPLMQDVCKLIVVNAFLCQENFLSWLSMLLVKSSQLQVRNTVKHVYSKVLGINNFLITIFLITKDCNLLND